MVHDWKKVRKHMEDTLLEEEQMNRMKQHVRDQIKLEPRRTRQTRPIFWVPAAIIVAAAVSVLLALPTLTIWTDQGTSDNQQKEIASDITKEEIVQKMLKPEKNFKSISGTFTYTALNTNVDQKNLTSHKVTYEVEAGEQPFGHFLVDRGKDTIETYYLKGNEPGRIQEGYSPHVNLIQHTKDWAQRLQVDMNNWSISGMEDVLNQQAVIIEGKGEKVPSYKLWVDVETGLIVQLKAEDEDGKAETLVTDKLNKDEEIKEEDQTSILEILNNHDVIKTKFELALNKLPTSIKVVQIQSIPKADLYFIDFNPEENNHIMLRTKTDVAKIEHDIDYEGEKVSILNNKEGYYIARDGMQSIYWRSNDGTGYFSLDMIKENSNGVNMKQDLIKLLNEMFGTNDPVAKGNSDNKDVADRNSSANNQQKVQPLSTTDVVNEIKGKLKMKGAILPSAFPLDKGHHLTAAIKKNENQSYEVAFYQTEEVVAVNDKSLSVAGDIPPISSFAARSYDDPNSATDIFSPTNVDDIPEEMAVDLGYGIKGVVEGAAGHQYLSWREGRWIFEIDSLSMDEMNNAGIAKKMVTYMEKHLLPAPKEKGRVKVSYKKGGNDVSVGVYWQDGNVIYELQTLKVPLDALMMTVSVK